MYTFCSPFWLRFLLNLYINMLSLQPEICKEKNGDCS
jgi:hypothetical protein